MKFVTSFLIFLILLLGFQIVKAGAQEPTSETLTAGKAIFVTNCVICHGDTGEGNGVAGVAMNPRPRNFKTDKFKNGITHDAIVNSITNGLNGTAMAGFGPSLKTDEIKAVAYYVLSLREKK